MQDRYLRDRELTGQPDKPRCYRCDMMTRERDATFEALLVVRGWLEKELKNLNTDGMKHENYVKATIRSCLECLSSKNPKLECISHLFLQKRRQKEKPTI